MPFKDVEVILSKPSSTLVVAASDSIAIAGVDYICDGVNDHVDIKAAIDALPDTGGRVILLEGTYNINNTINISGNDGNSKNITIEGQGSGTILKVANGNAVDQMSVFYVDGYQGYATNIQFKNFQIDGNKTNVTGTWYNGILMNLVQYGLIDGVYVHDGKGLGGDGYGFLAQNSKDITIRNSIGVDWEFEPIEIREVERANIYNNYFNRRFEIYETASYLKITNNFFSNCAIYMGTSVGQSRFVENALISNNYWYIDSAMVGGLNTAINLARTKRPQVVGNIFYTDLASFSGIISGICTNGLFQGNQFISLKSSGIFMEMGGTFDDNLITGNSTYQMLNGHGIVLYNGLRNQIKDNSLIKITPSSWGNGIDLSSGVNSNVIQGNEIANFPTYGINIASNTNAIRFNRFTSCGTAVNNTGSGNLFSLNIGYEDTEVVMYPVSQFVSSPDGADNQVSVYLASDRTNRRAFMRFVGLTDTQDMDMDLENRLPDTYSAFTGANSFSIDVRASDYANCQVTVTLMDIDGNVDATINAYDITPTANNTWQTKTVEPGSAYVAGEGIIIRVRVISLDSVDTVDVGRVKVSYKAVR